MEHILSDLYGSSSNHLDLRFSISVDSTTYESRLWNYLGHSVPNIIGGVPGVSLYSVIIFRKII